MNLTIMEQLMFSMVQVVELEKDTDRPIATASGFVMGFCESGGSIAPMLVTNKHTFRNCTSITVEFTLCKTDGSPDVGKTVPVKIDVQSHLDHDETDLTVLPLASAFKVIEDTGRRAFCPFISSEIILEESRWEDLDAIETVITMGYPDSRRDVVNNLPIFRRGITATHPSFDFMGRPEFLVDLPCFKGCSGSPVFAQIDKRVRLLGIMYQMQTAKTSGAFEPEIETLSSVKPVVEIPMNLGQAIKATKLLDFIPRIAALI